jgi:acyl dehydratase
MNNQLDEINKYNGIEAEPIEYYIDAGSIKLFADSIMDPDPLYFDQEYARATAHHGIIAPPTFFGGATCLRNLKAGDPKTMSSINLPIPKGWTSVAAGDEFHFVTPVRPGDILICREKMIGAYEKKGHSGDLIFVTREKTFTNQHGQTALIRKMSSVILQGLKIDNTAIKNNQTDHNGNMNNLPRFTVGSVLVRHLAMFAVSTAEFVDIHYDKTYAQSLGLPDVIIQGLYKTSIIAQMLKNWVGNERAIRWLNVQHRAMDIAGNTLTACGRVLETSPQDGEKLTRCEVWIENQFGHRTTVGTVGLNIP